MTDRRLTASFAALAVATGALALRLGPLYGSPLPFNPDGIIHARHAQAAVDTGFLPLPTLATDDLVFTSLLAVFATVLDDRPLYVAQPVSSLVGMVPCLLAIAYGKRIGRSLGWDWTWAASGGLLAGGLLAVDGVYLHRSMPTDEQTLGLLFVPILAVAGTRAVVGGSRRWSVVAGVVLVALPATHNLDTLIGVMALTAVASLVVIRRLDRSGVRAMVAVLAGWVALIGYTYGSARLLPVKILQSERVSSVPGLFLAWLVVLVVFVPWFVRTSQRTKRLLGAGTLALIFGLATIHAVVPIVPGSRPTPPLLLVGVLPLFGVAIAGAWVTHDVMETWTGAALGTLFIVVVALILFSFNASLTPDYFNLAYRSQTFFHLPAMTLTGVGVAALLRKRPTLAWWHPGVTASLVLVAAALSIPIAFSGLSLLTYKGVTTPAEYSTAQFADAHTSDTWAADNHIARLTWGFEDTEEASSTRATTVPVREWIGGVPPPDCPTVVQQSWTTVGAQLFPAAPETLSTADLAQFRDDNHVVYAAGTADPLWLVVPRDGADC